MPKNPIQFQKGLGLHEFLEKYGSEEQCRQVLYKLRWPTGYICPECGNTTGCELKMCHVILLSSNIDLTADSICLP
jgi:hypothetical protein